MLLKPRPLLSEATAAENSAISAFEELMSAKTKEVEALTASVETKITQIGDSGVKLVHMKEDLSDTQETLLEDKQFLKELEKGCKTKTAEWEERSKTRAEELVALADTIKILNDDDALELFKKTLPSASSLMQIQVSASATRKQALSILKQGLQARPKNARLELL